jgi:hypothetical protein
MSALPLFVGLAELLPKFHGTTNDMADPIPARALRFWDRNRYSFDRSGRSRNPIRGSVGFTRGLSACGVRSTSEFVSRPPNSLARPSCFCLVSSMCRGRVTRRRTMGTPLSLRIGGHGAADCASEPQRREPLGKGDPGGPGLPLPETKFVRSEGG